VIVEIFQPPPPLAGLVERFFFYEDLDVPYERERVLPDGTCHLLVNLRAEPRILFDREPTGAVTHFRRAWVSGTHANHLVIDAPRGASVIGVQFRPGGLAPFLSMPVGELRDRVVELDTVLGTAANDLRDALLEAPTPADKFAVFQRFLLARACRRLERDAAVAHAVRQFMRDPHLLTVDAVARETGWSHKHFIARFTSEVGLTPKRFCRLRRFQQVLAQIGRNAAVNWADLACACGYYDQAHFIREFSEFSGMNPTAYLRHRGEHPNHVPMPS